MAELALWLQLRKRSFHTVYQCRNATLNFHRYAFQVISQMELVQSEHYQWKVRVYQIEYLIFAFTCTFDDEKKCFPYYFLTILHTINLSRKRFPFLSRLVPVSYALD